MAKKTTEKKEFSWDTEKVIGQYGNEKERHTVNICTLNGKTYVQDTKEVMTAKNGWKRTKGNTMPLENFKELQAIVGTWEMEDAFGSSIKTTDEKIIIEAPKKSGLKAKHQAKGSAPALKGVKLSYKEKMEKNENFESLPKEKKSKVLQLSEAMHKEHGMVSVGLSKTNYLIIEGRSQLEAEKIIKATKGFARAKITYIP